ncbi:MAG: hypothetical protein HYU66_20805 [Armatimonadetes bacterium]|nr:hypothetical protein [Armatimonadota bacterium]
MNYRAVLSAVAATVLCCGAGFAQPGLALRAGGVALEVDPAHGRILRVTDTLSGIALAAREDAAENYRLVLLKPDKSTSVVLGKDQALSGSHVESNSLTLEWNGPLKDTAGAEQPIAVRMTVAAGERGLTFGLHLENHSQLKVQEAWYPFAGGLTGFAPDATLWVPTSTPTERALVPTAGGAAYGYPGHMNLSYACVQSMAARKTLYFGAHDPVARYKAFRFVETGPAGATDLAACIAHSPFVPPGGTWDGSPVELRFVDGDWAAAAQTYRAWFGKTFGIVQPKDDWIRRQSFFVMTMFMLPEGTISYTFRDIPKWAKAAKDHGINAVQVSGWQRGGHDNGYPFYEPDPRLGTWEELEAGIRACHRMGVKVNFFANYQPMMVESDWYKSELQKYREMRADGGPTWMAGWGMGTLWARAGHPKLMTWANLAFPQFRKVIVDYFTKLASIGGDGVHVDKMFPAAIDYNPDSPLSPDTATWEGAVQLTREIYQSCRRRNPDWCQSFECNWDRMLQFGGATWWVGNQLITRKVFPENVETLGLYQAYDYLGVNNAVRDGHAVMVAPLNFSRSVDWPPFRGLADYIKEVKRIRDELQDTVFFGEVLGAREVTLEGGPPDGVAYNVFRNRTTARRVCILTNSRMEARQVTVKAFDGGGGRVRIHIPRTKARTVSLPATVTIPGERLAFVEELGGGR